jgi:TonB family protein
MKRFVMVVAAVLTMGAAGPSAAQEGDAKTAIAEANAKMMQRYYPKGSLKRGEEGAVGVEITTDDKGYLTACRITKSSGYRDLDNATCDVMLLYGKTKPFMIGDRRVAHQQEGEFNWRLPAGVAKAKVADANRKSAVKLSKNDPNRMICRTQTKTGSLATRERICMSAQEWLDQKDQAQGDMGDMQRRNQMNAN